MFFFIVEKGANALFAIPHDSVALKGKFSAVKQRHSSTLYAVNFFSADAKDKSLQKRGGISVVVQKRCHVVVAKLVGEVERCGFLYGRHTFDVSVRRRIYRRFEVYDVFRLFIYKIGTACSAVSVEIVQFFLQRGHIFAIDGNGVKLQCASLPDGKLLGKSAFLKRARHNTIVLYQRKGAVKFLFPLHGKAQRSLCGKVRCFVRNVEMTQKKVSNYFFIVFAVVLQTVSPHFATVLQKVLHFRFQPTSV